MRTMSRTARMAGLLGGVGRGWDFLLNIGSTPCKQGKFRANKAESGDFAVLDLSLARIVNGTNCGRPSFEAGSMGAWLSWESASFAMTRSAVRSRLAPPAFAGCACFGSASPIVAKAAAAEPEGRRRAMSPRYVPADFDSGPTQSDQGEFHLPLSAGLLGQHSRQIEHYS